MDEDRKIRFLVAPILLLASIVWGAWSDETFHYLMRDPSFDWSKLAGLIAGGSLVVFAGGYIVGTITYVLLRFAFILRPMHKPRFHEVAMSAEALKEVWKRINAFEASESEQRRRELFAGAFFDYVVLRKEYEGVHEWLFRRWNGFNIAANSIVALYFSLLLGLAFGIHLTWVWCLPVLVLAVLLCFVMYWAWNDTMTMLDFMIWLLAEKEKE
jgi:hypothetical protein